MVFPPRAGTISIPAVIAGNTLQNDDTSISAIDSGFDGALVMRTENKLALLISANQAVSINTESNEARLTVNNDQSTTPTTRLSYQDNFHFDTRITSNGSVLMTPWCVNPILNPDLEIAVQKNFNLMNHNGSTMGLKLNGQLVTSSALQLNTVNVTMGVAASSKALVVDSDRSITNINRISATTLVGTLAPGPQLGITEIDTLNVRSELRLNGIRFNINPSRFSYLDVTEIGVARNSCALVVDNSRSIVNIGNLEATTLKGTITTQDQPNIRSVGRLNNINVSGPVSFGSGASIESGTLGSLFKLVNTAGNPSVTPSVQFNVSTTGNLDIIPTGNSISIATTSSFRVLGHNGSSVGLFLGNTLVTATAAQLNYNRVSVIGVAEPSHSLVLDSNRSIININSLSAAFLEGQLVTAAQPNIRSVSVLNVTSHNGTIGLALGGVLVTSTAEQLNRVNIAEGTALASKALVVDNDRSVVNIKNLSAESLGGVLTTAIQPNIRRVNTLRIDNHNGTTDGLTLGSELVTSTATQLNYTNVTPGVAGGTKALVLDNSRSITNINALNALTLGGTLLTPAQPNVTQVNTLNIAQHNGVRGLALAGTIVTSSATQLNYVNVSPGNASPSQALVVDENKNITGIGVLTAGELSGLITSPIQINIRTLRSINIDNHNGTSTGLSLNGTLVVASASQINALTAAPGVASPNKVLIVNGERSIIGINDIATTTLSGRITTPIQPNITQVDVLNIAQHNGSIGLSLGGTLVTSSGAQLNRVNVAEGIAAASKALVTSSNRSISNINALSASTLEGMLTTAYQPQLSSVDSLNVVNHNGTSAGFSLGGTLVTATALQLNRVNVTPGVATANRVAVLDVLKSISGISSLAADSIAGTLTTTSQPNIEQVRILNVSDHDGGSQGLRLRGTLVNATANQLNYTNVIPGLATPNRAIVTNATNSVTGVNVLTATKIVADQLSLSGVIANFNTGAVVMRTYSLPNLAGRIVDTQLLSTMAFQDFQPAGMTNSYSCEMIGYIMPMFSESYSFFVECNDRVRVWVNDVLILHSWLPITGFRGSSSLFLNASQWVKIYIQYQVDAASQSKFALQWASARTSRSTIGSANLAWDNLEPSNTSNHTSQNSMTIYNTATTSATATTFTVDSSGDLLIDTSGNDIRLGLDDSFHIPTHDGTRGLYLGGTLIEATALQLNYLKVAVGTAAPSKAMILDASKSIAGLTSFQSSSIACTNLTASNFTISDLTLNGPLNNYSIGALLIRQITGPDVSGRVVDVASISDLVFTNYDPKNLITNYSLDIIGYINSQTTELYTFHATANDRVRIWIGGVLVLNVWDVNSGIEYSSTPVSMTMGRWTPIYIQFQNIIDTSSLTIRWSSPSINKRFIPSSNMAWDNSSNAIPRQVNSGDSISVYSTQSGLITPRTANVSVDGAGEMRLECTSRTISTGLEHNFNITTHNGFTGLRLAGTLVTASAADLNRMTGITPGVAQPNRVLVLGPTSELTGLVSIGASTISGTLASGRQPNITGFGIIPETITSSVGVAVRNSTSFFNASPVSSGSGILFTSGDSQIANANADFIFGNIGVQPNVSTRKFVISANGNIGVQTMTPSSKLTINSETAETALRIQHNGSDSVGATLGVTSNGQLVLRPTGTTTQIQSELTIGSTNSSRLSVGVSGQLSIAPNNGSVCIGNPTNSELPLELGSKTLTLSGTFGYFNASGSGGVGAPSVSSFSLRTDSSIIVNGTVCITSDRRLKENIETLDVDRCKRFIEKSNPVQFVYKNDEHEKVHCGLIAQEVLDNEFQELVQFTPSYSDPDDATLNVSYMEIIPIMMTTIKDLYKKNAELEARLSAAGF